MEWMLIFCGIGVLVVVNVGANIISERAFPTLEGNGFGRHEFGILVKVFVFAVVMGVLGGVGIGNLSHYGLR